MSGKINFRSFNLGHLWMIILVIFLGLSFWGLTKWQGNSGVVCNSRESGEIYFRAAENMYSTKRDKLESVVADIKSSNSYQKDSNCLMILASYYIYESNPSEAAKYSGLLKSVYNPEKGYVSKLSSVSKTPEQIDQQIKLLTDHNQEILDSVRFSN